MADAWSEFEVDPRDPAQAGVRASDRDRDVVQRILTEAYAAGRLTREELDERSDAALASRTLGELPPLVADLGPATLPTTVLGSGGSAVSMGSPGGPTVPAEAFRDQAVAAYTRQRREAVWGMLSATIICVVIWALTGVGFFWPGFVLLGTGLNVGRVIYHREETIEDTARGLARREERAAERRRRRETDG